MNSVAPLAPKPTSRGGQAGNRMGTHRLPATLASVGAQVRENSLRNFADAFPVGAGDADLRQGHDVRLVNRSRHGKHHGGERQAWPATSQSMGRNE